MDYTLSHKPTIVLQGKTSRWWTSLVHVVPVGLSAVLLWLCYAEKYWFSEAGLKTPTFTANANSVRNWLQLAAKLYEIVVIVSMASITLKLFKRIFILNGIPFGLITGAYRVGDILLLGSSGFWKTTFQHWRNIKVVTLTVLFIITTLLSVLVGPASAVLIVPELQWFPLPNAFSNIAMPIFYYVDQSLMWPDSIGKERFSLDVMSDDCRDKSASFTYECPSGGFYELYNWAAGWQYSGLPDNITFQDPSGTTNRRLDMHDNGSKFGHFLTTPTALVAKTFGQFRYYVRSKDIGSISNTNKWKLDYTDNSFNLQPLVQSRCDIWNTKTASKAEIDNMTFPSSGLQCFDGKPGGKCDKIRNNLAGWGMDQELAKNSQNVTYVFITSNSQNATQVSNHSSLMFMGGLPFYEDGEIQGMRVVGCSFLAHWIPSTPNIDPSTSNYVETNITDLGVFSPDKYGKSKDPPTVGSVINIDASFLPYLDLSTLSSSDKNQSAVDEEIELVRTADLDYTSGTILNSMMMELNTGEDNSFFGPGSNMTTSEGDAKVRQVIEKLTGAIITDAIARMGAESPAYLVLPDTSHSDKVSLDQLFTQEGPTSFDYTLYQNGTITSPVNPGVADSIGFEWEDVDDLRSKIEDNVVVVDYKASQYGYGFGQPGTPTQFAQAVILAYLSILVLYGLGVLVLGGKTVAPWDDLQDLVALAWASTPPPELKGQGIGIVDEKLWHEGVSVKASDAGHVSMVFDNEQSGMKQLARDDSYY